MACRFIIVCPSRSGSTALRRTITNHPAATCHGEVFDRSRVLGWEDGVLSDSAALQLRKSDPCAFLYDHLFAGEGTTGFKLLYSQLAELSFLATLELIRTDLEIRIIHLWRADLCRRFMSEKRHRHQHANLGLERAELEILLSSAAMLHDCRNQLLMRERVEELFGDHPMLTISFEQLASELEVVADFLELGKPELKLPDDDGDWWSAVSVTVANEPELLAAYRRWVPPGPAATGAP